MYSYTRYSPNMKGLYFTREMPYLSKDTKYAPKTLDDNTKKSSLGYRYTELDKLDNETKKKLENNKFIKKLSQDGDVFVRFAEKGLWGNGYLSFLQIWHINKQKNILSEYRTFGENKSSQKEATDDCINKLNINEFSSSDTKDLKPNYQSKSRTSIIERILDIFK